MELACCWGRARLSWLPETAGRRQSKHEARMKATRLGSGARQVRIRVCIQECPVLPILPPVAQRPGRRSECRVWRVRHKGAGRRRHPVLILAKRASQGGSPILGNRLWSLFRSGSSKAGPLAGPRVLEPCYFHAFGTARQEGQGGAVLEAASSGSFRRGGPGRRKYIPYVTNSLGPD